MSSENGDGYIVIVWDERKYVPYCIVSKNECGERIGFLDGDTRDKIFEYKDHSYNDWIVDAPDYDGGAILFREISVADIPEGLTSEYEWNLQ